jgi:hypothetical protein
VRRYIFHEIRAPLHYIMLAVTGIKANLDDLLAPAPDCAASPLPVRCGMRGAGACGGGAR